MEQYGSMTVKLSKIELSKRGAKVSGNKERLIKRLEDYDRNNNFASENVVPPEETEKFPWPPSTGFKSVSNNTPSPHFTVVHILDHLGNMDNHTEVGHRMHRAIHRIAYSMMDQSFVRAIVSTEVDNTYYYEAQVNSEAQKKMTYFIKIAIREDGTILYSECECVSGIATRAECKHVGAFCYASLRFVERGEWTISETCTEVPQKWHLPKKRKIDEASPKKSEKVTYAVPDYFRPQKKKTKSHCYDPRPEMVRNTPEYSDFVRNSVINFSINKRTNLGIGGTYVICNLRALGLDHAYVEKGVFHQQVLRKIQKMAGNADLIEKRTRLQAANDEWHETRCHFVTASNVGTIAHITKRRNIDTLVNNLVNPKKFVSEATKWGTRHEKTALATYEKMTLNKVQRCALFISKTYPFIAGSPDGLVCSATVLEIKCPYSIRDAIISAENLDYLADHDGCLSLKASPNYYYQAQTQMFVTGRDFCDFFIWTTKDCKLLSVFRDDDVINDVILPKVKEFHDNYVVPAPAEKYFPTSNL